MVAILGSRASSCLCLRLQVWLRYFGGLKLNHHVRMLGLGRLDGRDGNSPTGEVWVMRL